MKASEKMSKAVQADHAVGRKDETGLGNAA